MYHDSFIVFMKTENIYLDIVKDVRFDISSYESDRLLPDGKNK